MQANAMRIMPILGVGIRKEIGADAPVERPPVCAGIRRFEYAAAGHADVHVARVARVDQDRMQLRAVGCASLIISTPRFALRMFVQTLDASPCGAAVLGSEQPLRRGARKPDARHRLVSRREPERVINDPARALAKRRRLLRLVPGPASIARAEDCRAEMACTRRG